MTHQSGSKFKDHPRITWFGTGGTVAYVDYTSAVESYCVVSDNGTFRVVPPDATGDDMIPGFPDIDAGIEYALKEADR